jgi:cytoskeletal protein CcmA (bactofilin family)
MLDLQLQLNILYIIIFILILDNFYRKEKEHFNNNLNETIDNIYQIDVDSIRNLSAIASALQKDGLTCPGNLTVTGRLNVDSNATMIGKLTTKDLNITGKLDVPVNTTVNGKVTTKNLSVTGKTTIGNDSDSNSPYIINDNNTSSLCIYGQGTSPNRKITMLDNVQINGNLNISGTITTDIINKQSISGNFIFNSANAGIFNGNSNPFFLVNANTYNPRNKFQPGITFDVTGLYMITLIININSGDSCLSCKKGMFTTSNLLIPGIISNIHSSINGSFNEGHNTIWLYPYVSPSDYQLHYPDIKGYTVNIKIDNNLKFHPATISMTFLCYAEKNMVFTPKFDNQQYIIKSIANYTISYL